MSVGSVGHSGSIPVNRAQVKKAQVKPSPRKDSDGDHDGDKALKATTKTPTSAETLPSAHKVDIVA